MRKEVIIRHIGMAFNINAFFLLISAAISFSLKEDCLVPLLYTAVICLAFGLFPLIFVPRTDDLSYSEAIAVVVLGWTATCLVGSVPYLMYGGEFTFVNAWFESVSGFTTTGSSILNDIESLPKGLLFWRSSTHWIGGLGIIIFVLLILPKSKGARMVLFRTEISDLSKSTFHFSTRKAIRVLAFTYLGLTISETVLLYIAGMNFFDAINHSFSTIATGGFSTKNQSIATFNNGYIEIIITVFMVLSGIHFGLLFGTVTFKRSNIFRSSVVRAYVLTMIVGTGLVALKLHIDDYFNWGLAFRYASFQIASLGTTTGFATVDTAHWPPFTIIILIYFTLQCAMVGSTAGGLKFDRVYLLIKSIFKQIKQFQHPRAVIALRMDHKTVTDELEKQTLIFILFYILLLLITTILLSFLDIDTMTAFSASATTIGNVGPGFGGVSSLGNFHNIPDMAKILLSINMLFGRLEIFNIVAFFLILRTRIK